MATPRTFVLDSSILLLYFAGDKRVEELVNKINDGIGDGYMLELCVSELFTKLEERFGYTLASKRLEAVKNSRIKVMRVDYDLMKIAGQIKSIHKGKLSMIAAYMIALAKNLDAVLVTSDDSIAKTDEVKVEYVRSKG
ncbi:MAG TPA: PIN domain-containing protein [Nitrososphaerales archaeon]|nr:PIN domain-containing protein [Nitrososphaerales archaeon]